MISQVFVTDFPLVRFSEVFISISAIFLPGQSWEGEQDMVGEGSQRALGSLQGLLPPLPHTAGVFELCQCPCASHRTLGTGNMPITHQKTKMMLGWLCRDSTGPMPVATTLIYGGSSKFWAPRRGDSPGAAPWALYILSRKQIVPSLPGICVCPRCYRAGWEGGARI